MCVAMNQGGEIVHREGERGREMEIDGKFISIQSAMRGHSDRKEVWRHCTTVMIIAPSLKIEKDILSPSLLPLSLLSPSLSHGNSPHTLLIPPEMELRPLLVRPSPSQSV